MLPAFLLRRLAATLPTDVADFWLRQVDPLAAVNRVWARVEAVILETPRVRTFVLRPNGNWRGFRAGQHVVVTLDVDGRRLARPFSLSGREGVATVRITVGRRPGGRVTGWLHERIRPGAVVELGQARGEFVLPDDPAVPLLLISGGTGITPCLAMLRTLAAARAARDVVLLCYAPRRSELIARRELETLLPARVRGLRVQPVYTREPGPGAVAGRFSVAHLEAVAPDFRDRAGYVCGPPDLMRAVEDVWPHRAAPLRREWFAVPARSGGAGAPVTVTCSGSGRAVSVAGARSLLEELEAAGLSPRYGCRAGICRQCTCLKEGGTVEELRTGAVRDETAEPIQLCAVRARSDLVLAL